MNGKRAKQLRRMAQQADMPPDVVKKVYKKSCSMDEVQEKTLLKQAGRKGRGVVVTQEQGNKESE